MGRPQGDPHLPVHLHSLSPGHHSADIASRPLNWSMLDGEALSASLTAVSTNDLSMTPKTTCAGPGPEKFAVSDGETMGKLSAGRRGRQDSLLSFSGFACTLASLDS